MSIICCELSAGFAPPHTLGPLPQDLAGGPPVPPTSKSWLHHCPARNVMHAAPPCSSCVGGSVDDGVGQPAVAQRHLGSPADVRVPEQTDHVDDEHTVPRRNPLEVGQLHRRPHAVAHLLGHCTHRLHDRVVVLRPTRHWDSERFDIY